MPSSRQAIAALAADDMPFAGNHVADFEIVHVTADCRNRADELMSDGHRRRNCLLRPRVPVPNMHVGAANRCFVNFYENIVDANFWHRRFIQPQTRLREFF
jgi:hypothetical protein